MQKECILNYICKAFKKRYYKLLFKHENDDGIQVYDDDYYFKVVKT